MKRVKRLLAVFLTLAMVLGLSMTALADGEHKPEGKDHTTATVKNVEDGATVTAYRIVEPEYNAYGLVGYKRAEGITEAMLENYLEPSSDEVAAIAKEIVKENSTLNLKRNTDLASEIGVDANDFTAQNVNEKTKLAEYTAELTPGYWIVIVTGSETQEVYNPMLIGVYYTEEGSGDNNTLAENPSVDADTRWVLKGETVYAKSEKPSLTKTITGSTGKTSSDGNDHGNDVAAGDTVNFRIDTAIPSYSRSYEEVSVEISDELSAGLTLTTGTVKVNVEGSPVEAGNNTFTLSERDRGFTIAFNSEYALANNGKSVTVTYEAVLSIVKDQNGVPTNVNFDANTNTAKLTYTNDPSDKDSVNSVDDETYTYTFGIDTNLGGKDSHKTGELFKVDENTTQFVPDANGNMTVTNPLANAEFTLAKAANVGADGKPVMETDGHYAIVESSKIAKVSQADGRIVFDGLDAGVYILEETKAPNGYSLEGTQHTVVIEASYVDEDGENKGRLKSYKITIDDENTSTYSATYTKATDGTVVITADHTGENASTIKNTKLVELPATGGIGTTIFTIGGCAIMIVAAGLYFASRRKKVK